MFLLQTFGGLSLIRAETREAMGAPRRKPLALLAAIAAKGPAGAPRDWLAGLLWPELSPSRARHTLAQTIYALRRELGDTDVIRGTDTLWLDERLIQTDL